MLPSGIYFSSFDQEARYLRTSPQRLWFIGLLLALALVPAITGDYMLGILTVAFITLIAVFGLQITVGMAGQINLGQSAFVGVGAFVAASLSSNLALPFWITVPIAGFVAAFSSILFSLPAMRVKGFYLALTTVAAQIMFPIVFMRLPSDWFGGSAGLAVTPATLFGTPLTAPTQLYYLALVFTLIMGCCIFNLQRSRVGLAFRALRDNDVAAGVMGIDPFRYKVLAFFAGAFFAGISGALYAYYIQYVTVEGFTLWMSVWYIGMLIVGGLHTPLGAIFGVIFLTTLHETTNALGELMFNWFPQASGGVVFAATNVVLGAVIVLALIFEPHGLAHRWSVAKAAYRIWPYARN